MAEEKQERELNRRGFLGRLGAAGALAGTGLAGWLRWRGGRASAQSSPVSIDLTPQQVQTIVQSGQPLFATYTPSGPTTRDPSAPLAITNPNILVIMVDQLRSFTTVTANDPVTQAVVDNYLPNLAALRKNSYTFPNYHVSAAMCTPSRSTILTGLYSWQTLQLLTEMSNAVPALDSRFPTFGTALNDTRVTTAYNNHVYYFGKWHLSGMTNNNPLEQYGFQTRT